MKFKITNVRKCDSFHENDSVESLDILERTYEGDLSKWGYSVCSQFCVEPDSAGSYHGHCYDVDTKEEFCFHAVDIEEVTE